MTLRARIAAVAGLAVAVAILATAVFTYLATRSSLRGEVDSALAKRADQIEHPRPGAPPLGAGEGASGARRAAIRRRMEALARGRRSGDGRRGAGDRRSAAEADRGRGVGGPPPVPGADGAGGGGPPPFDGHRSGEPPPRERLRPDPSESPFGGAEAYTQFVTAAGWVLRPPGATVSLPVEDRAREIARSGEGSYLTDRDVEGNHLRVLTRATPSGGAVQVARPLDEIDEQLQRLLVALAVLGVVGVAIGVGLGAVVARTALVPIGRFTSRTEKLSAQRDLSQRMEVVGEDELARLARSFNTTLDALESAVEAQRHLVADASHELRTPIASLRANVQNLEEAERLPAAEREKMHADIVEELDELTALVGDVVELARGAKPGEVQDDGRLDQLVEDVVERAERRAGGEVTFRVDTEPTLIRGEPERVSRAVSNLLGNALKWSPPGGTVEVKVRDGVLSVRDHGPGFREEDLSHIFERFYRAPAARGMPGSGLGLAIVQQAAEAHGGFVEASNAPGGGALLRAGFGPTLELDAAPEEPLREAAQVKSGSTSR